MFFTIPSIVIHRWVNDYARFIVLLYYYFQKVGVIAFLGFFPLVFVFVFRYLNGEKIEFNDKIYLSENSV